MLVSEGKHIPGKQKQLCSLSFFFNALEGVARGAWKAGRTSGKV